MDQRYIIDESVQHRYVGGRDARTFLPFLLPYLRSGQDLLDVGCGVGSIALDLAPTIAPGRVAAVDFDPGQVEVARRSAAQRGIDNVDFRTGSVYRLPYPDASFDVVYANAVLIYVREPVLALREMRRVLRPDGLVAVSDDDVATFVISPERSPLRLAARLVERAIAHEGGNPRYARDLRGLLLEAGFARTQGFALTPEVYGDAESTRWFADFVTGWIGSPSMTELILRQGWATQSELTFMRAAFDEWAGQPDAFAAWMYCAALGWVS